MKSSPILIELHYLPCLAYFSVLANASEIILECQEHYVKQTYRNRCRINTAQGVMHLTIPVISASASANIKDIRIDFSQKWLNNHWRTIQSAYGKAAFFEFYADDLHDALFSKVDFLYDLNYGLLSLCLKWLRWDMSIKETEWYSKHVPEPVSDMRAAINPKKLEQCYKFYYPVMYNQVFGSTFVHNLSLIDLVFCEGPGAAQIIRDSAILKMNK